MEGTGLFRPSALRSTSTSPELQEENKVGGGGSSSGGDLSLGAIEQMMRKLMTESEDKQKISFDSSI